jgi:hypothetical protein
MKKLKELEERRRENMGKGGEGFRLSAVPKGVASNEMCIFNY